MGNPDRLRLVEDLRNAVRRNGFVLHYQPVISVTTGETEAAEALLRWPRRGAPHRLPANFLNLAEDTGLIVRLGAWALRQAAVDAAIWPDKMRVSVNISPLQFAGGTLVGQVAAALEAAELPPERLELDITQAAGLATEDDDVLLTLSALRDLGVGIALGDFGVGAVGLAAVKHLPVTALKLHRALMANVPDDPVDGGMLRAAAAIGRALGVRVTAVGVETEAQWDFLVPLGIDAAQGFLLGRPGPAGAHAAEPAMMELAAG